MRDLKALALAYEPHQDRILAVVNPGTLDSWSFWLTRRLCLAALGQLPAVIAASSPLARKAPTEFRAELAAFEREAALASTAANMTVTPPAILQANVPAAELATAISVTEVGEQVRLEVRGERGGHAVGQMPWPSLQRTLRMIADEVDKAGWQAAPSAPSPAATQEGRPKPRVN
jgi:hypothetical protein